MGATRHCTPLQQVDCLAGVFRIARGIACLCLLNIDAARACSVLTYPEAAGSLHPEPIVPVLRRPNDRAAWHLLLVVSKVSVFGDRGGLQGDIDCPRREVYLDRAAVDDGMCRDCDRKYHPAHPAARSGAGGG